MSERAITLVEVGPRDGLQILKDPLSVADRVALIDRLSGAGLPRIEAASFVNPARVLQMAEPAAVLAQVARPAGVDFAGLALNGRGVTDALACDLAEVRFVVVASESFSMRNQRASIAETVAAMAEAAPRARAAGPRFTVVIAAAFGCPFEGAVDPGTVAALAAQAVEAGADEILLADTIGVGVPRQMRDLAGRIAPLLAGRPLGVHLHNTRNTGYANLFAAIEHGATLIDSAIGGLGGCPFAPRATGNIATEDVVWMLEREGHATGIDLDALMTLSAEVQARFGAAHTGALLAAGRSVIARLDSSEDAA